MSKLSIFIQSLFLCPIQGYYNTGLETGIFPPEIDAIAIKNQTDGPSLRFDRNWPHRSACAALTVKVY